MPRKPATQELTVEEGGQRSRRVFIKQWDYGIRNCLEFVLSVYLFGFLPLIMQLLVSLFSPPQTDMRWVPAEAWLFVMITSAAALGDSWRERRRSDGTLTLLVALFGGLGACTGALAYAMLMLQPANARAVTTGFHHAAWSVVVIVAILYFFIRLPSLVQSAGDEAERKIAQEFSGKQQKGTLTR
jgi:hypothetical protein